MIGRGRQDGVDQRRRRGEVANGDSGFDMFEEWPPPLPDDEQTMYEDALGVTVSAGAVEGRVLHPEGVSPSAPTVARTSGGGLAQCRLVFADGAELPITEPVVMGRNPRADLEVDGRPVRPVPLRDPERDLSRTHLLVIPDPGGLRVVDQGSANGTTITASSGDEEVLAPGAPRRVDPGAVLVLGDSVVVRVELPKNEL